MPTRLPRHTITETPPVERALRRLRQLRPGQRIDFKELVVIGAREKVAQLEAEATETGQGRALLLDMSAWARVLLDRLGGPELSRFEDAARAGEIQSSEPFLLEALSSARGSDDYARLAERLAALPLAPSGPATLRLALDAQIARKHLSLGLTDASLGAVAGRAGTNRIATFDQHSGA